MDETIERSLRRRAMDCLARKPMTRRELVERLSPLADSAPHAVDDVLDELEGEGYVDDAKLAGEYLLARSERLGHGRRRMLDELIRRGVDRAVAERAWSRLEGEGLLDDGSSLERRVDRAVAGASIDAREYRRLFNKFVRAGFGASEVGAALRPHLDAGSAGEWNDDDCC